jgi:hypothetical protein
MELLVVEGLDAGRQFTLEGRDGDRIGIGRGEPEAARAGAILLSDPELSTASGSARRSNSCAGCPESCERIASVASFAAPGPLLRCSSSA